MTTGWQARSERFLSNTRLLLLTGFGGLLVLLFLAGAGALQILQQIQTRNNQVQREFLLRNRLLNEIRSKLYLSGTYVRDYLLEPEARLAERHRNSLGAVRRQMAIAVASYEAQLKREEIEPFLALRSELEKYWRVLDPLLGWDASQRDHRGYVFLRDEVYPRRAAMLTIADRIAGFNEQQLEAGASRMAELYTEFRSRLLISLGIFLVFGVAMAGFTVRRVLNLEREARAQYVAAVEARQQLKDLSARLVGAQEAERRSISRELHDEIGQALSAVLVEIRNLGSGVVGRSEGELQEHIGLVKGLVENSVKIVRNMALLLRPSMLDDLGLVPALGWQAREVSKRTSLDVSVATESVSDDLPDEYKTCIYRVVQEALHNCSRHSEATMVKIKMHQDASGIHLAIQDDGRGFDFKRQRGLGLLGIEERVSGLGGTFQVHSELCRGTILQIDLPTSFLRTPLANNDL